MSKTYLGDSVYCEMNDCGQIVLTTENGYGPTNTIYLEPEVFAALHSWVMAQQTMTKEEARQCPV